MHDTLVVMKDGRKFCGPIWEWAPTKGYLTIVDNDVSRLYFQDMESAVTPGQRVGINTDGTTKIETRDEVLRACKDGWNGLVLQVVREMVNSALSIYELEDFAGGHAAEDLLLHVFVHVTATGYVDNPKACAIEIQRLLNTKRQRCFR